MAKLRGVPRRQRVPPIIRHPRPESLLRRYWDLLAVVPLMLVSFPAVWLSPHIVTLVPNLGLIDDHWQLDSTYKALRGIWIDRDVAFTHGPLYQWLSAIPARTLPLSFGAIYATWNTIPLGCAIVFAYFALRLILPEQPRWKRFILLLLLATYWEISLRATFPLLLFAVFLRLWYEVHDGRLRSAFAGIAGALLCATAFLVAADVGLYATAAWFICFVATAVELSHERFGAKLLVGLLSFAAAGFAFGVVVNRYMARPLDFKFWRDSLAQVAAYRWATPAAMTDEGATYLAVVLLISGVIFLLRARGRGNGAGPISRRTGFLLAAFVFGLAVMQSALVRSDLGHVIIGGSAMIFFTIVILFSFRGGASVAGVVLAIAASMLFSHAVFRPSSLTGLFQRLRHPMTDCPTGYTEFDRACYREPLTPHILTEGSVFLTRNSWPNDSVFVFPYQTMFGLASRRSVAGGLMQAYTASGAYLSRLEMSGLEGKTIPAALYLPDVDYAHMSQPEVAQWSRNYLSVAVDGVPNFTRAPEVWFWMVRHFRSAGQLSPGVVGLLRDDSRASRIAMQAQPLGIPLKTYTIAERRSVTDFATPGRGSGFDFIRLRMTVHYSALWKLRKPERLQLEITRANGSRDLQWLIR